MTLKSYYFNFIECFLVPLTFVGRKPQGLCILRRITHFSVSKIFNRKVCNFLTEKFHKFNYFNTVQNKIATGE
jgi:hypothetical protein